MYKVLKPDFLHEDDRGKLVQLIHSGYRQVNVIKSKANTVRGGHYHKKNHEAFYVVDGACEVTFVHGMERTTQLFSAGEFFSIEPFVGHIFCYPVDTTLIGLYDQGVEEANGKKDIFPIESKT